MQRILRLSLLSFLPGLLLVPGGAPAAEPLDQGHALFGRVLSNFVANAAVDYAGLKASPADLDDYLSQVASLPPETFAKGSKEQRLALLLNLYNAATLRLIIDHYPLKSIRSIGVLPGAAWRKPCVRFGGEVMSLDHLEHQIIRGEYDEPRIHFALVCAAVSCPPLRAEPYVAGRLDEQLDDQARTFLAATDRNRFDPAKDELWLSPIFDWYQGDFVPEGRSLAEYVKPFLPPEQAAALGRADAVKVRFTDYDWSLNDQKKR
jgi:hypothetical protein